MQIIVPWILAVSFLAGLQKPSSVKIISVISIPGTAELFSAHNGDEFAVSDAASKKVLIYDRDGKLRRSVDLKGNEQFSGFDEQQNMIFSISSIRRVGRQQEGYRAGTKLSYVNGTQIRELDRGWLIGESTLNPFLVPGKSYSEGITVIDGKSSLAVLDTHQKHIRIHIYRYHPLLLIESFSPEAYVNARRQPVLAVDSFASICFTKGDTVWHFGRNELESKVTPRYPLKRTDGSLEYVLFRTNLLTHSSEPVAIFSRERDPNAQIGLPDRRMLISVSDNRIAVAWQHTYGRQEVVILETSS